MSNQDIERSVNKVMKTHKRKVSQLEGLKDELGLYFDEDQATRIAKETMKQLNPNIAQSQQISVEYIVAKARKEHKRKVSQFQAIKGDIAQYFPDEEDSTKLAAQVMKEFNPNDKSGKHEEVTINEIVENALTNHRRKVSQFRSIQHDLATMYDEEDVNAIAKDVMKQIFAQKNNEYMDEEALRKREERANKTRKESVVAPNLFGSDSDDDDDENWLQNKRRGSKVYLDEEAMRKRDERANKKRKESIATPDLFGSDSDDYMDNDALQKREKRANKRRQESIATPDIFADDYDPKGNGGRIQQQIEDLEYELQEKNEEIEILKQTITDIAESKKMLAINSNRSLNQMREYLLKYQQTVFNV